jgi:hypothetical protein
MTGLCVGTLGDDTLGRQRWATGAGRGKCKEYTQVRRMSWLVEMGNDSDTVGQDRNKVSNECFVLTPNTNYISERNQNQTTNDQRQDRVGVST